jgi:Lysophospholipase L1 and related esterases
MLSVCKKIFVVVGFLSLAVFIAACGTEASKISDRKQKEPVKVPPAASDKPKIVAFGDSLTAGFGLTEKESYPYLLQQKLNAEGYNYEVVNAGVSGDTSQGGLERVEWSLEQGNVEIMILALGGNDLLRGLSPAQMKRNLSEIIKKAKAKNVKVLLCGMLAPPTMGEKYQREFTNAFPDLADEHEVAFMPFILEGIALDRRYNQPDGIHPNAEGARLMTENIYKSLKPLLEK